MNDGPIPADCHYGDHLFDGLVCVCCGFRRIDRCPRCGRFYSDRTGGHDVCFRLLAEKESGYAG